MPFEFLFKFTDSLLHFSKLRFVPSFWFCFTDALWIKPRKSSSYLSIAFFLFLNGLTATRTGTWSEEFEGRCITVASGNSWSQSLEAHALSSLALMDRPCKRRSNKDEINEVETFPGPSNSTWERFVPGSPTFLILGESNVQITQRQTWSKGYEVWKRLNETKSIFLGRFSIDTEKGEGNMIFKVNGHGSRIITKNPPLTEQYWVH